MTANRTATSFLFLWAYCCWYDGRVLVGAWSLQSSSSFAATTTNSRSRKTTQLAVIQYKEKDFEFDTGLGGVRLAEQSVLQITGIVSATAKKESVVRVQQLLRYSRLTRHVLNDSTSGAILLVTGQGTTVFKDPGESTIKEVTMGPQEAVRDAWEKQTAGSSSSAWATTAAQYPRLVINFAGSEDSQVLDVMAATQSLVQLLVSSSSSTTTTLQPQKFSFNSISHSSFPMDTATVTVVGLSKDAETKNGEIFYHVDGSFWTLSENDLVEDDEEDEESG
jgi:hypothetical protein